MRKNTPIRSSERLEVSTEGNVLRITNDPGYTSDNPEGAPRRAVDLYRGNVLVWGRDLPLPPAIAKTLPDERWAGYFDTREGLAAWRYPLTAGDYKLRVWGGSFFPGWGDHPQNEIEWGIMDVNGNLNEVSFTVSGSSPPPPPPVSSPLPPELATAVFNSSQERKLATARDLDLWRKMNPREFEAWWGYVVAVWDSQAASITGGAAGPGAAAQPPSLKTHAGRTLVGEKLESVIAHRLAKP